MNRKELVDAIAKKTGQSKVSTEETLAAFLETVVQSVKKDDSVTLIGFGTFKQVSKKAREGRNPSTGEKIKIPAKKTPKFVPGKQFRDAVN